MRVEPSPLKLNRVDENIRRTAKKINEVRLDVSARGCGVNDQTLFFTVSGFHTKDQRYTS